MTSPYLSPGGRGGSEDFRGDHMVFRGTGGNQLSLTYKGETVENRLLIGGGVPLNAKKTSPGSMSKFCDNQNLTPPHPPFPGGNIIPSSERI